MEVIRISELSRSFSVPNGGPRTALHELTLSVFAGERLAVLGANGAGKTTLLRILSAQLEPTQGDAWIQGRSVRREPAHARTHLGWVPAAEEGFFPKLTGLENLYLFSGLQGLSRRQTHRAIERFEGFEPLTQALRTSFYFGSSGMKQSLRLVRALLHDPEILLMDEPTRSLDAPSAQSFRRLVRERLLDKTIVFATHSEAERDELASRRLYLREGRGDEPAVGVARAT